MKTNDTYVDDLFAAGSHFAYTKSRRHPSVTPFIFGTKNRVEIFDLEATSAALDKALNFIKELGKAGKTILLVSGKAEAIPLVRTTAELIAMPYVAGRFIGGTLTNFTQIRKRVDRLQKLMGEKEAGELTKYTKKERLLIDREIERLNKDFGGIVTLTAQPSAIVLIDPKQEKNAVAESKHMKIPTVALANSDCNINEVTYAVPGNDSLQKSIKFFLSAVAKAYTEGKTNS